MFKRNRVVNYVTNPSGKKYYHCRGCHNKRIKKYYSTLRGREVFKQLNRRMYRKHREKWLARSKLNSAIKTGKIKKPDKCSICSTNGVRIESHHDDYSRPLDVIWVCTNCHADKDRL
ncbi:MAG TPA: hypothetical protein ENI23_15015 [bacterium]|nr:hypothetical protein [bacterium]